MRVLVVGPGPRVGAPNHLPWLRYAVSALQRTGHTVATVVYRESWFASPSLAAAASGMPPARAMLAAGAAAAASRSTRRVVARARAFRPDLTVVLKGEVYPAQVWADVKRESGAPVVTWWLDSPWDFPHAARALEVFDRVFMFDRSYLPELAARGITQTAYLPCAADETVYRPLILNDADRQRYGTDVAFVGTFYPGRGVIARELAQTARVRVWGNGWQTPEASVELGGAPVVTDGIVDDRTAAKIYNASAIGYNAHHPQTRLGGLNMRTFELLAAGTAVLVDRVAGIEALLEPGREVACYGSAEEAREAAAALLKDSARRTELARRGRERLLAEHTYVARMRELCRVACS